MASIDPRATETPFTGISVEQVYAAIADVLDPELDEPLVKLGFVDRVIVRERDVTLLFKLPTYWCAPNFAYLMASDLRNRVQALPGIEAVHVVLLDHFAEDEINRGIDQGQAFFEAFPGEAVEDGDLEELRRTFLRKGFLMRQDALIRQLLKAGLDESTLRTLQVSDITIDEEMGQVLVAVGEQVVTLRGGAKNAQLYLQKRRMLGLPHEGAAALITDERGGLIVEGGLQEFLRRSRSVRLNIMFNTSLCKGLFLTRYKDAGASEAHREADIEGDML